MPRCENCSSFVTEAYVRVFSPADEASVRACPHCEDKVRENGVVRQTKVTNP